MGLSSVAHNHRLDQAISDTVNVIGTLVSHRGTDDRDTCIYIKAKGSVKYNHLRLYHLHLEQETKLADVSTLEDH